ncbi:MAG: hypothetical protein IKQ75_02405 [Bacteroidales bacterium]|nr:hypothetical protein [Bacteroidales bacterium]MBR6160700.1 hypothetical protein [Bacteroidales bacterium]
MSQKIPIKKFSFRILVFSVVVAALTVLFQWLCPAYASPALPFIVLFFLIITLFSLYIVLRDSSGKAGKQFVSNYMLSRVVKLLSCLLFLVLYMVLNKKDAWRFAIAFLIIYFLYAIVEVIVLKKENEEIRKQEETK